MLFYFISNQTIKVVPNEGMPTYDESRIVEDILYNETRGNLFVLFNVVFPKFIPSKKKEEISAILENYEF